GDRRDGSSPSTTCRSVRQTPQTLTRIKISPGPGDGLGASLHCNGFNSTGPGESSAQACMGVPSMKRRLRLLSTVLACRPGSQKSQDRSFTVAARYAGAALTRDSEPRQLWSGLGATMYFYAILERLTVDRGVCPRRGRVVRAARAGLFTARLGR